MLLVISAKIQKRILTINRATQQGLTKVISKAVKVFKCVAKVTHFRTPFSYLLLIIAPYSPFVNSFFQKN